MRYKLSKKLYFLLSGITLSFSMVYAAVITLDAPESALANRAPIVVTFSLDSKGDILSGISGNFSFPSDLFSVADISTRGSVISLFVKQPSLSLDKYIDGRTHIVFEGIFPGGYSGVRSPYKEGVSPGVIFSVTLIPKGAGVGSFIMDDIVFHSFDSEASILPSTLVFKPVTVPELIGQPKNTSPISREVKNDSLTALITRDPLINNNAWYLLVNEDESTSAIESIFVAETNDWNGELVASYMWREVQTPYVLLYQDRSKYVHVKVLHKNGTYVLKTLSPVENSTQISFLSRILIGVTTVLLLLYFYAKSFFIPRKENSKEKS